MSSGPYDGGPSVVAESTAAPPSIGSESEPTPTLGPAPVSTPAFALDSNPASASVSAANEEQQQQQQAGESASNETSDDTPNPKHVSFLESLIDDVIFCECLQVHRAAKMGFIFTEPGDEMYKIKDGAGLDVFGQPLSKKKQYNCTCPNCSRNLAASRLAPHLEKCMGMGRLSARAASNKRDTTALP